MTYTHKYTYIASCCWGCARSFHGVEVKPWSCKRDGRCSVNILYYSMNIARIYNYSTYICSVSKSYYTYTYTKWFLGIRLLGTTFRCRSSNHQAATAQMHLVETYRSADPS